MRQIRFKAGATIFEEGEVSRDAFLIGEGRVEILKNSSKGLVRLALLGERDVFGEMGLLDDCPRSATARAYDKVLLVAMNRSEFLNVFTSNPQQGLTLLRALFERLRSMDRRLVESGEGQSHAKAIPDVALFPDSEEAKAYLPQQGIKLSRFPFRIGRQPSSGEEVFACNELELPDSEPFVVSLNHLAIDLDAKGVMVRDRGSASGGSVNGADLAGLRGPDTLQLHAGENFLTIGPRKSPANQGTSPFRFRILVT